MLKNKLDNILPFRWADGWSNSARSVKEGVQLFPPCAGTQTLSIFNIYPLRNSRIVRYNSGIGGQSENSHFNWFRCYHTRCDNRHRILSRWFQLDYWFFELANQTQRYINFEYRKINNHCFSSKSIFYFLLPFENNIIKSISYEIIQNNQ